VLRWVAFAVVVLAPAAVLVIFALQGLLWVALVAVALIVLAAGAGRRALATSAGDPGMPSREAAPPERAFVIMNPRSGGGKVARFGLKERAEALGAEVALLDGPGTVDVAGLARQAVAGGADLLGVAGGDGTQALVAGIAAEHALPFLVISAGTRNHFALDLGLDRENPADCLDALTDPHRRRSNRGRGRAGDPGRDRRGDGHDAHAGAVRRPAGGAAGPGAEGPPWDPPAQAQDRLVGSAGAGLDPVRPRGHRTPGNACMSRRQLSQALTAVPRTPLAAPMSKVCSRLL
jgi:Diacylglycerol kinase catalytic domain